MTAGTVCRQSAGPCDLVESCTGASAACPDNVFAPSSSTACAPWACSGNSPTCTTSCTQTIDCAPTPTAVCLVGACTNVNVVFVTSAQLTGASGYDAGFNLCVASALDAGLSGNFVPLLASRIQAEFPYPNQFFGAATVPWVRRGDKAIVASGGADLFDGTLSAAISYDEHGQEVSSAGGTNVWTGSTPMGGLSVMGARSGSTFYDCGGAQVASWQGIGYGQVGSCRDTSSSWIAAFTEPCGTTARLYCFQRP